MFIAFAIVKVLLEDFTYPAHKFVSHIFTEKIGEHVIPSRAFGRLSQHLSKAVPVHVDEVASYWSGLSLPVTGKLVMLPPCVQWHLSQSWRCSYPSSHADLRSMWLGLQTTPARVFAKYKISMMIVRLLRLIWVVHCMPPMFLLLLNSIPWPYIRRFQKNLSQVSYSLVSKTFCTPSIIPLPACIAEIFLS